MNLVVNSTSESYKADAASALTSLTTTTTLSINGQSVQASNIAVGGAVCKFLIITRKKHTISISCT